MFGGAAFGGDVLEIDCQTALGRVGIEIKPAIERLKIGFKAGGGFVLYGIAVLLLENRTHSLRERLPDILAQQRRPAAPEQTFSPFVDENEVPVRVQKKKRVADIFESGCQPARQGSLAQLSVLLQVDVLKRTLYRDDGTGRVSDGLAQRPDPDSAAFRGDDLRLCIIRCAIADAGLKKRAYGVPVFGRIVVDTLRSTWRQVGRQFMNCIDLFRPGLLPVGQVHLPRALTGHF